MKYQEIAQWLNDHDVFNYTIHDNLVVDVDGDVNLSNRKLTELPFQFGNVSGHFYCSVNKLTTLQYCPTAVGGNFSCYNNKLTSLQYCPTTVGGNFSCYNNKLTSLQYCPTTVGGFYCYQNPFIISKENESGWLEAIKNHKKVYSYIKEPTESLTNFYKMIWEV